MTARDRLFRDAGVLTLATAVALGSAGVATAKKPAAHFKPAPHNFIKAPQS